MILPNPKDALHKAWLYRVLIALIDKNKISQNIYFKGGTCASMLGFLNRFSIDLDFDLKKSADKNLLRSKLLKVFKNLNLKVKETSEKALLFILKYPSSKDQRNSLKLSIVDTSLKSNIYRPQYLKEVDRYANCQTIETMFGHKLVAVTDRFKKYQTIAGRDLYDIHYFFTHGFTYKKEVIEERTNLTLDKYLQKLILFIEKKVTQKIIDQDLNTLLPPEKFASVRKTLKTEILMLLRDEKSRF